MACGAAVDVHVAASGSKGTETEERMALYRISKRIRTVAVCVTYVEKLYLAVRKK